MLTKVVDRFVVSCVPSPHVLVCLSLPFASLPVKGGSERKRLACLSGGNADECWPLLRGSQHWRKGRRPVGKDAEDYANDVQTCERTEDGTVRFG